MCNIHKNGHEGKSVSIPSNTHEALGQILTCKSLMPEEKLDEFEFSDDQSAWSDEKVSFTVVSGSSKEIITIHPIKSKKNGKECESYIVKKSGFSSSDEAGQSGRQMKRNDEQVKAKAGSFKFFQESFLLYKAPGENSFSCDKVGLVKIEDEDEIKAENLAIAEIKKNPSLLKRATIPKYFEAMGKHHDGTVGKKQDGRKRVLIGISPIKPTLDLVALNTTKDRFSLEDKNTLINSMLRQAIDGQDEDIVYIDAKPQNYGVSVKEAIMSTSIIDCDALKTKALFKQQVAAGDSHPNGTLHYLPLGEAYWEVVLKQKSEGASLEEEDLEEEVNSQFDALKQREVFGIAMTIFQLVDKDGNPPYCIDDYKAINEGELGFYCRNLVLTQNFSVDGCWKSLWRMSIVIDNNLKKSNPVLCCLLKRLIGIGLHQKGTCPTGDELTTLVNNYLRVVENKTMSQPEFLNIYDEFPELPQDQLGISPAPAESTLAGSSSVSASVSPAPTEPPSTPLSIRGMNAMRSTPGGGTPRRISLSPSAIREATPRRTPLPRSEIADPSSGSTEIYVTPSPVSQTQRTISPPPGPKK